MYKYLILSVVMIVVLCGCGDKSATSDGTTMDMIVLNFLNDMGISPNEVQRITRSDAVYYQINIMLQSDLEKSLEILQSYIEHTHFRSQNIKRPQPANQVVRAYYDAAEKQRYVIEITASIGSQSVNTATVVSGKPQICIIVDDFGNFDGPLLDAFAEIKPPITFAVIPGLPFSKVAAQKAINAGHEVIVHMPMEPENENVYPGANAIFHNMSSREITERVAEYFTEINVAVGANQHMGSRITQNKPLMRAALRYLSEKDYFFVDSRTTPNSVAREVANELGIAFAERDLFLDAPADTDEVLLERLNDLKRLMETKGRALVITHCHDRGRLQRLQRFITAAENMGFEIVPAAQYVQKSSRV